MNNEKSLNLLTDRWLPVLLQDDSVMKIKIAEIGRSDIVDIISPRADFRGAIYQLIIGLLQTAFAPQERKEWLNYWLEPPEKEKLEAAFFPFLSAFILDSPEGEPAFMQDLDLPKEQNEPVEVLFFGGPGESTRKKNTDLFIKREAIKTADAFWAAITLFTFQTNTAGGGRGYRVTLRGGGPVTTLLQPPEGGTRSVLWKKLWVNILTKEEFSLLHGNHDATELSDIFPWMAKTRTSEKDQQTLPVDTNPLQMYWPMPERIRFIWESGNSVCDVSGEHTNQYASFINKKNNGVFYSGGYWIHPLTPYEYSDNKPPNSLKGRAAGEGYRNWAGFTLEGMKGKIKTEPAKVVEFYYQSLRNWLNDSGFSPNWFPRLWVFGYDLESAKAKCWYESEIPIFNLEQEERDDVAAYTGKMTEAASDVLKTLKSSLKIALFRDPKNDPNAKKFVQKSQFIDANFWSATESNFYSILQKLVSSLENEDKIDELLGNWRQTLKQEAQMLFDQYALSNLNEDGDLKRVIKAREGKGGLQHYLNGSKALKALVA